jgi:hypothetical protein
VIEKWLVPLGFEANGLFPVTHVATLGKIGIRVFGRDGKKMPGAVVCAKDRVIIEMPVWKSWR